MPGLGVAKHRACLWLKRGICLDRTWFPMRNGPPPEGPFPHETNPGPGGSVILLSDSETMQQSPDWVFVAKA